MKFLVEKEKIFNGIKLVANVAAMKSLQPVLANILIETTEDKSLRLTATDFDLTISTIVEAQIEDEGKITLPAKKLNDIVSRLADKLITFELNSETNSVNIKCENAKFDIKGISASEFPNVLDVNLLAENAIDIEMKPFIKAIRQASFAAANFETNNLLSGVVCDINENTLEMASTDGNRLARVREKIENIEKKSSQLIIPSKTTNEFLKMSTLINDKSIKIYTDRTKLILKTENSMMISRIMEGQYPKYNQLIPTENPKTAIVNRNKLISALELVSIMVNEKTSIVKFDFSENNLVLRGDTPDSGASEETLNIDYKGEDMTIAFNYKYVIDGLKNMEENEVKIEMNTNLSPTVFRPNSEEDYISLIMPVQMR
ncbi:DNA polymerase III subunit beta [bacterium]|nr:DNA polymerase III subunit beta [bacterium]